MLQVEVRNENIDESIRILKRLIQKDGIFQEIKLRNEAPKPSCRRKLKERKAESRRRKKEGKNGNGQRLQ